LFKIAWDTVSEDFMAVVQVLTGIMKVLTGILTGDWKMALEGMKDIFDGVWRAIVAAFKGFINIIITGINTLITGLNKIHFSVPDWVPGLGGMSWGIDIPKIPMLAKGGIIDSPTLAMIGEGAEAEAVTPISVLRSMIQDAVSSVSGTVGGGIVQHFYFNNVMPMSVSETARKFKQAGKELALEWGN
jgi:hypothetical protein